MKRLTLHQLQEIVGEGKSKYTSEAVLAAQKEISLRGEIKSRIQASNAINAEAKNISAEFNRAKAKPFFRFIKSLTKLVLRPDTHRIRTTDRNRLLLTIRFYFITILLLLLSGIPLMMLGAIVDIELPEQTAYQLESMSNLNDRLYLAFLIPVVAALVEETSFRLILSRFNRNYFNISVAFLISYIISDLFGANFFIYSNLKSGYVLQGLVIQLVFGLPVFYSLSQTNIHSSWFEKNWRVAYRWVFYGLALVFALGHLPNFGFTLEGFVLWPFYLLPFLVYAFVFSYVRIRIGFKYAVLLHFIVNAVIVVLKLLRASPSI